MGFSEGWWECRGGLAISAKFGEARQASPQSSPNSHGPDRPPDHGGHPLHTLPARELLRVPLH